MTIEEMSFRVSNCWENPIGHTHEICKDRGIASISSPFFRGAPSLLKHLLGDVTMAAVGARIVPNVRELSGPHDLGL